MTEEVIEIQVQSHVIRLPLTTNNTSLMKHRNLGFGCEFWDGWIDADFSDRTLRP